MSGSRVTSVIPAYEDLLSPGFHVRLTYEPASDPYAVRLEVPAEDGMEWWLARELLTIGSVRRTGAGAVHVEPVKAFRPHRVLAVELNDPAFGALAFRVNARHVKAFVTRTYLLVPPGHESDHLNLDAELARLLSDGGPEGRAA